MHRTQQNHLHSPPSPRRGRSVHLSLKMAVEESGMFRIQQTVGTVLCCKCGILVAPNAANTCVKCLKSEVDITEGLHKSVIIMYCPECNSYLSHRELG